MASFAVPPQTFFSCRPCSALCRALPGRPSQRKTYAVVRDGASRTRQKLVCFAKDFRKPKGDTAEYSIPTTLECDIPEGNVCGLDVTSTTSGELSSVLVAYENGRVVSIQSDLGRSQEVRAPFGKPSDEVEYFAVVDEQSVRKGILKDRADVLAALDQAGTGALAGHLFCQIVRSRNDRRFELCLLRNGVQNGLQAASSSVQSVMSYDLPVAGKSSSAASQYEVHAASAKIYSLEKGRVSVYDIGSTVPKVLTTLGDKAAPVTSFARLSTSTVATTSASTATVYETTYGSVQSTGKLQVSGSAEHESRKRKRDEDNGDGQQPLMQAVSAFSELGLLVLLSGNQLLAVQLGDELSSQTRGKGRPTRLADVLGSGTTKDSLRIRHCGEEEGDTNTTAWATRVDALIESNDIEGLERLVASDETLGRQRKPEKSRRKGTSSEDVNVDEIAYGDLWPLPESLDSTKLNRERILHILSKIFSYAPDEPQIEVRIASRKLLEWLALTGQLNCASLEKALAADHPGVQREPVRPGDVMTAISEIDEDFELIHSLLSLPARWELSEVIQAMCLLIRSFDAASGPDSAIRRDVIGAIGLNSDNAEPNGDVAMVNGDDAADSDFESESKAAETELEHVERILMSGLEVRSDTLRVILERLHAFPGHDVTNAMRDMMTQKELIFLIHMLRIELADGGWTSRYVGAGAEEEKYDGSGDPLLTSMVDVIPSDGEPATAGPSNQAIRAIGDLLNCAVDAVGTSGWLVGLSGDALGTEELLESLRAEVSAGLEGCYEANTLGTFLAELERFTASKPKKKKDRKRREEEVGAVLPMGGKAEPTEFTRKCEGKKSKHVIAMEKSKRVGKYSLDRIRF